MVQIPINPFDNDRLKTRKVQQALEGLGLLPPRHADRPNALESKPTLIEKVNRALGSNLKPASDKAFARALNAALAGSGGNGGGGGGSYTAQAVHFDTNTVVLGNMTGTDGPLLGMSLWFSYETGTDHVWASFFQADNGPTICLDDGHVYIGLASADFFGPGTGGASVTWVSSETVSLSTWHHLIIGTDCTDADPANWKVAGYLDDVPLTLTVADFGSGPSIYGPGPLNNGMFNNNMQIIDWHQIVVSQNVSDLFIFLGQSLLTGADISLAHRRMFIDGSGKPVDPATAVAGLGGPTMLFSGNATGFPTNQGSGGGAFAVSEGALTNATTSPSD